MKQARSDSVLDGRRFARKTMTSPLVRGQKWKKRFFLKQMRRRNRTRRKSGRTQFREQLRSSVSFYERYTCPEKFRSPFKTGRRGKPSMSTWIESKGYSRFVEYLGPSRSPKAVKLFAAFPKRNSNRHGREARCNLRACVTAIRLLSRVPRLKPNRKSSPHLGFS